MTDDLKDLLEDLAAKYEVASFSDSDPVQFLNWSENRAEAEIIALFSAMLAFGNRKIFIPKIKFVLEMAEKKGGFYAWIKNSQFENDFKSPNGNNLSKFYRFYSYEDVLSFFRELSLVLKDYGTLENAVRSVFVEIKRERLGNDLKKDKRLYGEKYDFRRFSDALFASEALGSFFQLSKIVPKGKTSANKRVHMFFRWMVRVDSPVDKGFWTWINPSSLIIPLDTHVLQEAEKFGLLNENSPCSIKTALILTDKLSEIWPDDPCKGDYALFGLGVSDEKDISK